MKRKITLLTFLIFTTIVFAQAPNKMSYQAVIRDGAGELLINQSVSVKLSVLQGSATGTAIYVETHTSQTNENGLLSIQLGAGEVQTSDFDSVDWSSGPYFLQVETDPTGGTTYTINGASEMLSVPFALFANTAGGVAGPGAEHYVGELYGGGIVFYVYEDGQHGLIASLEDLDNGNEVAWGRVSVSVETNAWDGATNTSSLISTGVSREDEAAGLCYYYPSGGFSDWFLPSIWELNILFDSAAIIGKVLYDDGDDTTQPLQLDRYWSSTSTGPVTATAFGLNMGEGIFIRVQKSGGTDNKMRVRAIRAF